MCKSSARIALLLSAGVDDEAADVEVVGVDLLEVRVVVELGWTRQVILV